MRLEEVGRLIARHAGELTSVVDGVAISRTERAGPPEISMTGASLVLMVQGAKRMAVGDRVYEYGAGQCLVTSVDIPVTGHFVGIDRRNPALGFAMTLRPPLVADLLLRNPVPQRDSGPAGIAVADATDELIDAVGRMVGLLERPRDRLVLAPLVERELHWLALSGPLGATVRQMGLADGNLSRVSRAVGWIRDHYSEPVRVDELAQLAQMSTSSFHRSFRAITALSPIQYQKRVRLQEARVRLLAQPDGVTGVAYAVGYESPSQFSREYRRFFGAPPSQDVARLRATGLAASSAPPPGMENG